MSFSKRNSELMNILEHLIKYNSIELFCKEIISLVNKIKILLNQLDIRLRKINMK